MDFLVLLYFSMLPFQWALSPSPDIDLALSRVFACLLVILWTIRSFAQRSFSLPRPIILFFLASFIAINTASFFWAENQGWALRKIVFLWNFFPLFIVFSSLLQEASFRKRILPAFVGGSAIASLVGILEFLSQFIFETEAVFSFWIKHILPIFLGTSFSGSVADYPSLLVNISGATVLRASAFFPDPHMFSLYLGLSLPFAGALTWKDRHKNHLLPMTCLILIIIADLLTFSRGGYLGIIAGLLIAGILVSKRFFSDQHMRYLLFSGITALFLCSALVVSPFGSRLVSIFSSEDGSNAERLRLWQETTGYIADRPLIGAGIGNYPLLAKPSADYREPIYAHNLFLDIASETGLIGLMAFLGFLSIVLLHSLHAWIREENSYALAAFIALIIFSTHSFFELPLFSVQVLPLFLLVTAFAHTATDSK